MSTSVICFILIYTLLFDSQGTATVRSISFHPTATTKLSGAAAFQNMYNLRLLKIYDPHLSSKRDFQRMDIEFNYINRMLKDYGLSFQLSLSLMFNNFDLSQGLESLPDALRYLHWLAYPLKSLPTKFSTKNLVELRMPCSKVVGQIWNKGQVHIYKLYAYFSSCISCGKFCGEFNDSEHFSLICHRNLGT